MKFQFDIEISEQDYLDFNTFHLLRSPYGKKQMARLRGLVIGITCVGAVLYLLSDFDYIAMLILAVFMLLYLIFLNKIMVASMKRTIKTMKKQGKLPYTTKSFMEFDEEYFTETTPEQKTEYKYAGIERISIVEQTAIYLHLDSARGYILPVSCFASKEQYDSFLAFIKEKCAVIDVYKGK